MDSGDLAIFAAVARSGGVSRAAVSLNTVQSNVTQRVRRLEAELAVTLFHRHSRGVSLTSAGEQLLPYAERIARLLEEAREATARGTVARGRIVIGALETATALRLPPILAAYAASCPEVDIEIKTGTAAALIDDVLAHRVEAAFVAGPVSHAALVALPLIEEELVLVTAPGLGGFAALAAPDASRRLKLIGFRPGCSYRARLEALLAARGFVALRRLEFGTLDGIIGCVAAGIGVSLLPRAVVARHQREGKVALVALPPQEARVETLLIRRRDGFVSTALRRFIETAREELGPVAIPLRRTGRRAGLPARLAHN